MSVKTVVEYVLFFHKSQYISQGGKYARSVYPVEACVIQVTLPASTPKMKPC